MDYLRRIYPRLNQRAPAHPLYVPFAFAILASTVLFPGKTTRVFLTFPPLCLLVASYPFYTAGTVNDDYGAACALIGALLMYIDFFILTPLEGNAIRFLGHLPSAQSDKSRFKSKPEDQDVGIGEDDCTVLLAKLKFAARVPTLIRGIGWNIQVKGVPPHPNPQATRFAFCTQAAFQALRSWIYKMLCIYVMGFAMTVKSHNNADSRAVELGMTVLFAWCAAAWAYNGIKYVFYCGAAVTVAVGLFAPWEWPPIFGSMREAWSVRQMWSVVWHQLLRRLLQTPGIRLARLLGLRKGTLGSKYLQLYLAFAISFAMHEWQIFHVTRRDMGELRFFMSQPVAITAEDFVQWCWREYGPAPSNNPNAQRFAKGVGYVWTFGWFSYSLSLYAPGQLASGLSGTSLGEPWMLDQGKLAALRLQSTMNAGQ